jgi:hypothetical protein
MGSQSVHDGITRREAMGSLGAGSILIAIDPTAPHRLTTAECRTLDALGDTLLPGAAEAGIARYVDDQLGRSVPLLFLKYMDYPDSLVEFYRAGLRALDEISKTRHGRAFADLDEKQRSALVRDLSKNTPPGWNGPPAPLFYFVTRNDAADVYYGTPQGFAQLGVPYASLKRPPANW